MLICLPKQNSIDSQPSTHGSISKLHKHPTCLCASNPPPHLSSAKLIPANCEQPFEAAWCVILRSADFGPQAQISNLFRRRFSCVIHVTRKRRRDPQVGRLYGQGNCRGCHTSRDVMYIAGNVPLWYLIFSNFAPPNAPCSFSHAARWCYCCSLLLGSPLPFRFSTCLFS